MTQPVISPSAQPSGQPINTAQSQRIVISGDEALAILCENRPEDHLTVEEAYQLYLEERFGRYGY